MIQDILVISRQISFKLVGPLTFVSVLFFLTSLAPPSFSVVTVFFLKVKATNQTFQQDI